MKLKNNILRLIATAALCAVMGTAGCNPAAKFSLNEASVPTLNGLTSLHGRATLTNAGTRDFTIEGATITVKYRDRPLTTARLLLPIELPAGAESPIRYDFALDDFSLSSLRTLQSRILTNPAAFTADLKCSVRWGLLRKKIEREGVPLVEVMEIISNFAP